MRDAADESARGSDPGHGREAPATLTPATRDPRGIRHQAHDSRDRSGLPAFDPLRFTVEDVIAEGDKVVVRWKNAGTHSGSFLGIPATNKTFSVAGIDVHLMRDGRMAEHWHVVDQLGQMQQLGLIPGPGDAR